MKSLKIFRIWHTVALLLFICSAPAVKAVSINITGQGAIDGTWEVTTVSGTFNSLQDPLSSQVWWGNSGFAGIFTGKVGSSFGSPNDVWGSQFGPFFAYAYYEGVDLAYFNGGNVVDSPDSWDPDNSWTWGIASRVPDTGSTAALLGVGVFVLAAARRRLGQSTN
ncbi:MAG: VPDSG-CTERM sorting domain-containing protein [Opitutales bacterium]|nr:VPDSG-CTERM sorting domain-containing protein [Opitutales bacterium]